MKSLSLIACISKDGGLGHAGGLLWNFPEDMAFFRTTTLNHPVVMGSKTYLSIGRPLPQRTNLVLSRSAFPEVEASGGRVFHDSASLDSYLDTLDDDVFIIGGARLYTDYLTRADTLYLTEVDAVKPADTFFPEFDRNKYDKTLLATHTVDGITFTISKYTKL